MPVLVLWWCYPFRSHLINFLFIRKWNLIVLFCQSLCLKKQIAENDWIHAKHPERKVLIWLAPKPLYPLTVPKKAGSTVSCKLKVQCIRMSYFMTAFLSGKEEESSLENCKDWRWVFRIPCESSCCITFSQFSGIYQLTQVLASWTIFWLCPRKCKELILLKSPQKWYTTASVNYLIKRQNLLQL